MSQIRPRGREAMTGVQVTPIEPALIKLAKLVDFGPAARLEFKNVFTEHRTYEKSSEILSEGDELQSVLVLVDGFACSFKTLVDGGQQNLAIYIPGDMIGWAELLSGAVRASIRAITPVKVQAVSRTSASDLLAEHPALERAVFRSILRDSAITQEWIVGFGRRSALQRLAHLLCELYERLRSVGLTDRSGCAFPLTQDMIAATLGLSVVHTNRMLQQLRAESLIVLERGYLSILDWPRLTGVAAFDAGYLSLTSTDSGAR